MAGTPGLLPNAVAANIDMSVTGTERRLDAELGIPPSPVLADAHLRILRHDWSV